MLSLPTLFLTVLLLLPADATFFRLNCGGGALPGVPRVYADAALYHSPGTQRYSNAAGRAPSIYNTHAWMPKKLPLVYRLNAKRGAAHTVTLHFAEIFAAAARQGARLLDIRVNDRVVKLGADIFTMSGSSMYKPVTFVQKSVYPVNGFITVRVVSVGTRQNAMISGIDIKHEAAPARPKGITPAPRPAVGAAPLLRPGSLLRLNCGGGALQGNVVADSSLYRGGTSKMWSYHAGKVRGPSVYNSHVYTGRFGTLRYEFRVPYVSSALVLRFSETYPGSARRGARAFTVSINGRIVARNIDVYTLSGGRLNGRFDLRQRNVYPVKGKITVEVRGKGAMISGIDVKVGRPLVQSGKWRIAKTTGYVVRRHESCAVMVAGKVYMIGGRRRRKTSMYDPKSKRWETRGFPPVELNHMQCASYKERFIYVAGAWYGSFPREKAHMVTFVYDTVKDTWANEPGLGARARGGGAFVQYGGKFYLAFGNRGGHGKHATSLAEFDVYDPVSKMWKKLPDAPHARDHVGGAVIGSRFCVGGGRDGGAAKFWESPVLSINCFNFNTWKWEVHPNLPEGRAGAATGATCQGLMMIAGGEGRKPGTAGQAFSRVDLYNPVTRKFKTATHLVDSRHGSGLAVADCRCGNIYLPSGSGNLGGAPELPTMEVWSPDRVARDC